MSTTVSYKGETLTTVTNQTRTLTTQGKYLEANIILTDTTQGGGTYQSKTVSPSTSQQTVRPDTGYDALSQVTVNAMPAMNLPQYPDSTATGTSAGIIYPGQGTRYLNIPTGYNDSAKHYEITPMALGRKTITQNGTYTAEYDDLDGYYEVEVNVSGGGGGGTPWSLGNYGFSNLDASNIAVFTHNGEIKFASGMPNVGAWILLSTTTRTSLTNGMIVACIGDSAGIKTYAYTSNGVAEISTPNVYISVPDTDAVSVCFDDQSGGYTFANGGYALLCLYKDTQDLIYRTLTFRTATYAPASGQTSAQYSLSENPPIYFCGLSTTVTLASYHRVQTVVKADYGSTRNLAGTNFYTTAISYLSPGEQINESYANGTLTISTNSSSDGGYFHNPGTYTLHYFLAEDLAGGGSGQTKSRTYTPTTSTQTEAITPDTGYDGLDQVNITVNPIPSEYVIPTGSLLITQNGIINVYDYETVNVNVQSSGGNIDTKTLTATNYPTSLAFTGMSGRPSAFFLRTTTQISSSGSTTYYYITDMRYNGTNTTGNCFRIGSTRRVDNITNGYSWSYSGTTLTITSSASSRSASPGSFYNGTYELVYIY